MKLFVSLLMLLLGPTLAQAEPKPLPRPNDLLGAKYAGEVPCPEGTSRGQTYFYGAAGAGFESEVVYGKVYTSQCVQMLKPASRNNAATEYAIYVLTEESVWDESAQVAVSVFAPLP